ncbi:hypothetical protein NDU88_004234 [Pleurodeles waltl]|uniref:Uncharacterized protein n=1 Tax=Pleurodeles waltl TaxID=8319 RepID=A0AAV7VIQ5_PLEWA|nr:hypothetical protein NDU88_004234 [Pleurodeles waltl]
MWGGAVRPGRSEEAWRVIWALRVMKRPRGATKLIHEGPRDSACESQEEDWAVGNPGTSGGRPQDPRAGSGSDWGGKKKEKKIQFEALERDIRMLTDCLPTDTSPELQRSLQTKQAELRDLPEDRAGQYAQVTQRQLYDTGNQANKLLAWLDRRDQNRR